jgi:CRP-like cAMP-binding protein
MPSENPSNHLLQRLSRKDRKLLGPLEAVDLVLHAPLETTDRTVESIDFIEAGFVSVVADGTSKDPIEIGLIGNEGMSGLAVVLGDTQSPFDTYVQGHGTALRVGAAALRQAMAESPALRAVLLRYARTFVTQIASTAAANGRSNIEERLARWLLMVEDRMGRSFPITHEFLSIMLAVQRPGVTLALQSLATSRLIAATRGNIEIIDRQGLIAATHGAYGLAEREYLRLLPLRV